MPCTTTGTTWSLCGHSIYQHTPTCHHPGTRCTKKSTAVPGICPSCTQLEFHPSPAPETLPSPISIIPETETQSANEVRGGGGIGNRNDPGVGNGRNGSGSRVRVKIEDGDEKGWGVEGRKEGGLGAGIGSGGAGKDYFFELHIRQLEERLEAARLREAEKNVEISSLKAQVGLLLESSKSAEGYQSEVTRSVSLVSPRCLEGPREQSFGVVERNGVQAWGPFKQGNAIHSGATEQVDAKLREVTPNQASDGKEKLAHIAAISFTAPIISQVVKLKSAIYPSDLEYWFEQQVKFTFQCAGEGAFGKMVKGYRDFVDFIGVELKGRGLEGGVKRVLGECEEFVQVVIDVEEAL